ncbi:phosphopantetheine-binding protein [Prochlorococcus sp. MIT 1223]|uniref:phosphopantetheine-binding protein n=1 Tax=Prochlorococcus sp. MIT 1223 TaxID=3096217 RepID=UPI002A7649EE|nr:phosphopantetheine-binding protein [Prochlorococcus sp. MIT 1223]
MTKGEINEIICSVARIEKIENDQPLISSSILDSFSILILISKLELKFNITIALEDIDISNIDTVDKIYDLLTSMNTV